MSKKNQTMYFLGIDAGGTSCKARLEDKQGNVLAHTMGGAANTCHGATHVLQVLTETCKTILNLANLGEPSRKQISIGIGIAGFSRKDVITEILTSHFFSSFKKILITTDAEIANVGAHSGLDGGVVIIGTGSIGYASVEDTTHQIGGHGFLLSDQGSGAYMGLEAVKHYFLVRDQLRTSTIFSDKLYQIIGSDVKEIYCWVQSARSDKFAKFAPIVVDYFHKGDPYAKQILFQSAKHISNLIDGLVNLKTTRLALIGGLAETIEPILDAKYRALLRKADHDPLHGAILLAKRNDAVTTELKHSRTS